MKIVMMDGGLSNQLTQYIFARCLEEELKDTDELVMLDDLWFFCEHNAGLGKEIEQRLAELENDHYQLNKFPNIKKIQRMSEYFDADVWQEIVRDAQRRPPLHGGSYLPQILKDNGLDLFMIAETDLFRFDGKVARMPWYHYIPEMLRSQGNCYYFGWFTNGGWFMSHEEIFRRELAFAPLWKPYDLEMQQLIRDSLSISVHIRRGGYAYTNPTDGEYFKAALQAMFKLINKQKKSSRQRMKTPRIFVFSDEIDWVHEHAADYGLNKAPYEVVYGAANRGRDENQCDMQLMSECDMMILESNSVYSYFAALMNTKPNKVVINPNKGRGVF